MESKHPILPHRIRRVPKQFSWLDHRLVRKGYIDKCSHSASALYLFLVTVGDARGMSYYGDESLMHHLSMDLLTLTEARNNLIRADLIAFRSPLYQVLSFDNPESSGRSPNHTGPLSLGEILKRAAGGAP
jgi:hypothetical protein